MNCIILWNIINLMDGEASWFFTFLLVLTVAAITTHAWRWLCTSLQKKFLEKNELIKNAAVQASLFPVVCYIWFISAVQCVDLISDRFFTESLSGGLKYIFSISAVLLVGWFLLRLNHNIRQVLLERSRNREIALDPGKVYGICKLASVIIIVLIIILLMEVTGVSVNTLIAFGGISGLAIAFASQEIIANFFGGIMIHVNQPFQLGDLISLPNSSIEGTVEEIGWYETILRSKDKQPIYIPNALFSKAYVINGQRRTHRRVLENISIRHKDLTQVPAIVQDMRTFLEQHKAVDTSQNIMVYIDKVATCSIDLTISCLSTSISEPQFLRFRDEVLLQAAQIIKAHDAEIAIPVLKNI